MRPDQMGRIIARLVDAETGAPVTEAFVEFTTLERRALSDSTGTVAFYDLPPGRHELVVRHIGYGEQTVVVEMESMTSAIVGVQLAPRALAVAPLEVLIEHRPRYLEEMGFYLRRAEGQGTFFDPQFVERWNVGMWARVDRFLEVIRNMSPTFSSSFLCTGPSFYVDGRRDRTRSLEVMSTYMVGAVEVYSSGHGVPDFALDPDAACGVIAIWTNRWRGRTRELGGGDVALCEPSERGTSVVEGTIRDEFTGVLLPGARVYATLYPAGRPRAARVSEIVSDREARYRVCDIPPDHTLSIQAWTAQWESPEYQVPVEGPVVTADVTIRLAGPGDLVGRVIDRGTGRPVAAADIAVRDGSARTQSDEAGYFRLEQVLPGDHLLRITHLGFEPFTEVVSVVADRTLELRVELSADPIALEPLVVTALRDRRLELRGYYDRRTWGERTGLGHFLDGEAVERRMAPLTTSLLRDVPGLRVSCSGRDCRVGASRGSDCTQLSIYINGSLALREGRAGDVGVDELVRPSEIAAVEVYPGAASLPAEFSGTSGRCGAVVIWTH